VVHNSKVTNLDQRFRRSEWGFGPKVQEVRVVHNSKVTNLDQIKVQEVRVVHN
jgi:hypothetical protein